MAGQTRSQPPRVLCADFSISRAVTAINDSKRCAYNVLMILEKFAIGLFQQVFNTTRMHRERAVLATMSF